jgi:ubiquinone/menaquinone biosynthesis C-methylase UbiE
VSSDIPGSGPDTPQPEKHHHSGKSSERFLNLEVILEALNIQPGQTILDAGCGNGYMAKAFAPKVGKTGKVFALDPDVESIAVLRKETQGTNIEALEGDVTQPTPLQQASFDLIYLATVIHGFSPQEMPGFLGEVQRLLKPDGVLAIVEIEKQAPFGPPVHMRFSPEGLKDLVPLTPLRTLPAGEHFYLQIFKNTQKPGS